MENFSPIATFAYHEITIDNEEKETVKVMGGFEEKHAIGVDDQPVDGEAQHQQKGEQKRRAVHRKHGPGEIPKGGFLAGRGLLKRDAVLELLYEADQRIKWNDERNEIKERVGDDKINEKSVRGPHGFQMPVALKVVDGGRNGEGSVLQLVHFIWLPQQSAVIDHLHEESRHVFDVMIGKGVGHNHFLMLRPVHWIKW